MCGLCVALCTQCECAHGLGGAIQRAICVCEFVCVCEVCKGCLASLQMRTESLVQ